MPSPWMNAQVVTAPGDDGLQGEAPDNAVDATPPALTTFQPIDTAVGFPLKSK